MKLRHSDTIAAIATPLGEGAISVLRVSGPDAISKASAVFRGAHSLLETPGYTIRYGRIVDENGDTVDEVLVSVFRAPTSYTGEDSIEISCHGGLLITKRVLGALLKTGVRQADPGEFTKRAFLNGKMDLCQAEAVADTIRASSEKALKNSQAQLGGQLGEQIRSLKSDLMEVCSLLELELDFSEDNIVITPTLVLKEKVFNCRKRVQSAISSFSMGKMISDGVSVAIVGRPNVGKSSVFNRLLMEQRAIVSPIPGTTRDFLEESIAIEGLEFRLIDTAGLRIPEDSIEEDGIHRAREIIESADIVLLVLDSLSADLSSEELEILKMAESRATVVVENKIDLVKSRRNHSDSRVGVSALTGEGFTALREKLIEPLKKESSLNNSGLYVCSLRQMRSLTVSLGYIDNALGSFEGNMPNEVISSDLRLALDSFSEIVGEVSTDDILNSIFSSFCIGK